MSHLQFSNVLFLCVANSARSQMAEGLARSLFAAASQRPVRVMSAGTNPARVNPYAIQVMAEIGIDLSKHTAKSVTSIDAADIDLVITLCHDEVCPTTLRDIPQLHWPVADPQHPQQQLSDDERLSYFRNTRDQLRSRISVLAALHDIPAGPDAQEFHASVRVPDLPAAARFYSWLLGIAPKEWTHRYVTFVSKKLRTNFVLLVSDGKQLHHDTLYHLGIGVSSRDEVIAAYQRALAAGWPIHKPARTTWRGTPLHELWLKDPGDNLIEIYARLTAAELAEIPADKEPVFL